MKFLASCRSDTLGWSFGTRTRIPSGWVGSSTQRENEWGSMITSITSTHRHCVGKIIASGTDASIHLELAKKPGKSFFFSPSFFLYIGLRLSRHSRQTKPGSRRSDGSLNCLHAMATMTARIWWWRWWCNTHLRTMSSVLPLLLSATPWVYIYFI